MIFAILNLLIVAAFFIVWLKTRDRFSLFLAIFGLAFSAYVVVFEVLHNAYA